MDLLPARLRHPDLLRRIAITLAALAVYRLGCWIPLPGINLGALLRPADTGQLATAFERVSLMALGLLPMLSALMLLEAAMIVWPRLRRWAAVPANHVRLTGWTNAAALGFAVAQSYGLAHALEDLGGALVAEPGPLFRAGVVASQVGATAALIWLASVITRHGIGNGVWILIAVPYAMFFADALLVQAALWGPLSPASIALTAAFLALAVAAMAVLLMARPALAAAGDLVWVPVLGFALSHWLLSLIWIGHWLVSPAQTSDFVEVTSARGLALLPLLSLALIAVLRRRSLAKTDGLPISASVVPLVVVMAALAAFGSFLEGLPQQPLFPSAVSVMLLAAVGLAVVTDAGDGKPAVQPGGPA